MDGPSPLRTLWHPHQKLWNWALVKRIRGRFGNGAVATALETGVIVADSLLLALRARARRAARLRGRRSEQVPGGAVVLYIDCGLHKRAEQVLWMDRWFGERYELHVLAFEAGSEHARDAAAELQGIERVRLHQLALVGPEYEGEEARLYKAGAAGKADSLFEQRGDDFEVVPARRLSTLLAEEGWDLARTPTILRMNIEGAEQYVIDDLLAAGLGDCVDGYYGMWDDLSKIDAADDERFRRRLGEHGIATLTFNDRDLVTSPGRPLRWTPRALPATLRDLSLRLRRRAIRRDIESAIQAGIRRASAAEEAARRS